MMNNNNFDLIELDTTTEINNMLENIKNSLKASVDEDVKIEIAQYQEKIDNLSTKLADAEKKLLVLTATQTQTSYNKTIADTIFSRVSLQENSLETIFDLIELLYTKTYKHSKLPDMNPFWWLYVSYYNDRKEIFALLDAFNIEYPKQITEIILPCEWNETQLDWFFKNIALISCPNGAYFDNNLQYWDWHSAYNFQKNFKKDYIPHGLTIPFQFVLQNPLLNTEKYMEKILNIVNTKQYNYFRLFKIFELQNISEKLKYKFFSNINTEIIKKDDLEFFIDNIKYMSPAYVDTKINGSLSMFLIKYNQNDKYAMSVQIKIDVINEYYEQIYTLILQCTYNGYNLLKCLPYDFQKRYVIDKKDYLKDGDNFIRFLRETHLSDEDKTNAFDYVFCND